MKNNYYSHLRRTFSEHGASTVEYVIVVCALALAIQCVPSFIEKGGTKLVSALDSSDPASALTMGGGTEGGIIQIVQTPETPVSRPVGGLQQSSADTY